MTPLEALLASVSAGVHLSVTDEGKLRARWDTPIAPEILASLKEHRDWIIAHLLQPPSPPHCRACGRPQHHPDIVCGPDLCPSWQEPDPNFPIAPAYVPLPPLPRPCPDCGQHAWWTRADGGQVCGVCHPDPRALFEQCAREEAPME